MRRARGLLHHNGHMRTIVRLVAGVFATLVVLMASVPSAAACDCADLSLQEQVDGADVVARVTVEKSMVTEPEEGGKQVVLTMLPARVWKGEIVSRFTVTTALDGPECGLGDFPEGTDLLLFATESESQYSADLCGGTVKSTETEIAELAGIAGPGELIDPVVVEEPGAFVWPTVTAVASVAIVLGLVVFWWIAPRRRR